MQQKIKNKIKISISIIIGILFIILFMPNKVSAMGTWQGNMPSNSFNPTTGMFPQKSGNRTVTLSDSRFLFNTRNWNSSITSGTVYCADQGKMVRFGKYDPNTYYLSSVGIGQSFISYLTTEEFEQRARAIAQWESQGYENIRDIEITSNRHFSGPFNENEYAFITFDNYADVTSSAQMIMTWIMSRISQEKRPTPYSTDIDSSRTYTSWNGNIEYGPKVAVLENTYKAGDGYAVSQTGTFSSSGNDKSKQAAYILTALSSEIYAQDGNYSKKYSEEDIQTAYWMLVDPDGIGSLTKLTANGKILYEKAVAYNNFTNEIANGYKASIIPSYGTSKTQVIANQETEEYIIGPFTANYPDYQDISYIKSMFLTTDTGSTLIVDESHSDFEIVLNSGTAVPGANGITKKYPKNGEMFFVKFSAKNTNYPTSVKVGANFEYINNCTISYKQLETEAHIYQYIGYCEIPGVGDHPMAGGPLDIVITARGDIYTGSTTEHTADCTQWDTSGEFQCCNGGNQVPHHETRDLTYSGRRYYVGQPYVKMSDLYELDKAQPLTETLNGKREYKVVEKSTTVDLTMELGGIVWEDADGGKEDISNGTIDISGDNKERKIPNVPVTLYNEYGEQIGETTETDSNGEYRFTGLNAMYKYYVKFTYNGQYYQPTTFVSGNDETNGWGKGNWSTNSNAKDVRNERLSYNAKFESIRSAPTNYEGTAGYNETFTKLELLGYTLKSDGTYEQTRTAVIDDFGNLILQSSNDATTKKMIQYVKDCRMDAYTTADNAVGLYPVPNLFVIDQNPVTREYKSLFHDTPAILYNNAYCINLGLDQREESDIAIKKDVEKVALEINGQEHIYTYDTLENKENAEKTWDISLRLSDAVSSQKYYDTNYSRELYTSDYLYKVSDYGTNYADYGKVKSDELEVYITYKVMIRNQAMSIQARIDEVVDYYDEDLEYVDIRSYIEIKRGTNAGKYAVQASGTSRYESISKDTVTTIDGYDNLYIRGLSEGAQLIDDNGKASGNPLADGIYLEGGQTAYVYLTFRVKKDSKDGEEWVRLDEQLESATAIGVGKENIVELNGYSTRYAKGTTVPNVGDVSYLAAGIVDRDSKPGNLKASDTPKDGTIKYENFEDDTDKAPNIRIILNRDDNAVRVISGTVFEDERTESIDVTTTGDGIRDNKDKTLINGVTVQLVELMENGEEYIWRTFENGSGTAGSTSPIINKYNLVKDYTFEGDYNGAYAFKSFVPGKYIVRFIYGDTVRTVTPSSLNMGGLNEKSYNGQDFKSTTYQEGIEQNKVYTWRAESTWVNGQETLGNVLTEVSTFKADASNNETANAKTNQLKAYLYDITASDKANNVSDAKDVESRRNEVVNYSDNDVTNYLAEVLASHKSDYSTMNDRNTLLNDLITNTKMTAETGLMVVEFEYDAEGTDGNKKDNTYKIQNVDLGLEERPKAQLVLDKEVTNVKLTLADGSILFDAKNTATNVLWRDHKAYSVGYTGNVMDADKFGSIANIRNKNSSKFGLVQLSMDEELMHGATMEITYQVTVTNVGEVDYKDNLFYYTGNKSANAQVVTTRADQVIDYVANNLQFNVSNNSNWEVIEKDSIKSQGLVHSSLDSQVEKFNTVIITKALSENLVPNLYKDKVGGDAVDSVSVPLVLTQLITSENDSDDLTYRNLVEIVKTSNTVGRRMEYSVVGNQDPEAEPQELDSDIAEVVRILPPFGNAGIYITIALIVVATLGIVVGGTIFIKKKVLRK